MTAPDIFLSYNREDQAVAKCFAEAFEAAGLSVWWDAALRSGEAYDRVTEEALRTAKAVVVLWSPRSVDSRWVRAEATLADRNRTLVPARIEACDLPIMFELTQTLDLSHWRGEATDPAWQTFLGDVRRMVGAKVQQNPHVDHPAARPPRRQSRPSIAVLPFVNRSNTAEDETFAEAIVEDLTAALSTVVLEHNRKMKVIAASATAAYRTGARDLRQIGSDLHARYLLEGNVRRVVDDIRVGVQLVEAEEGDILWSQRFDRPLAELSALQEDLVNELAAQLGVQVNRAEYEQVVDKGELETFDEAMLRVAYDSTLGTRRGSENALQGAIRAVELKPDSGDAYANLAALQSHLAHVRGGDTALASEAAVSIGRARELGSSDPVALVGIATALAWLGKPKDGAMVAKRAIGLSPGYDMAHYALGAALARLGHADDAVAALDAAERVAPNSVRMNYLHRWRSIAHLQAGRIHEALASAEQSLRLVPDVDSQLQYILCLAETGRRDEACQATSNLRDMEPEITSVFAECLVSDLYCGSTAAQKFADVIGRLWTETGESA
jgi:TolB-like protein